MVNWNLYIIILLLTNKSAYIEDLCYLWLPVAFWWTRFSEFLWNHGYIYPNLSECNESNLCASYNLFNLDLIGYSLKIIKKKKDQLNTLLKLRVLAKHIVKDFCRKNFTLHKSFVHGIKAFTCVCMKTFHSLIKNSILGKNKKMNDNKNHLFGKQGTVK